MCRRYTKEELYKMDAIKVYELVLEGKIIKKFPDGFWQQPEALNNAKIITKYLIEKILKWTEYDIKSKLIQKTFNNNKLSGMLQTCFNGSVFKAIDNAYKGRFKIWEFSQVPRGYWDNIENCKEAIKWLIEDKLNLTDEEIKKNLNAKLFEDNCLGGMLACRFNSSPFNAINTAYEGKYNEWEFGMTPINYWSDISNGVKSVKWLIEDKLKISDEDLKDKLSEKLFSENGLSGMLQQCFAGSPLRAIDTTYPGKFKKEDFKSYNFSFHKK